MPASVLSGFVLEDYRQSTSADLFTRGRALSGTDLYEAWMQRGHPDLMGSWDRYSTTRLVKLCDRFNECQLFRAIVGDTDCLTISDVGCATGRYYRYFRKTWPFLEYKGFDISDVAIEEAGGRFPKGSFTVFDGNVKSLPEIASDIVWSRDVVHHQTNPGEFLSDLYDVAGKYLILRVRTREVGSTVFDASQSCQYTYGRWVPYVVYNTSELVDLIRSFRPAPMKITVRMNPIILGGLYGRYVPKELYYPERGTAETAVLIQKRTGGRGDDTVVAVETHSEFPAQEWMQWIRRLARRLGL